MTFRPWGVLDWALRLSQPRRWAIIGALGTEERCLAGWHELRELGQINVCRLLNITDVEAESRHVDVTRRKLAERKAEFLQAGGSETDIAQFNLLDPLHKILLAAEELQRDHKSIVLDISSLPKRFFFPLLRSFSRSDSVKDLVLTYTAAQEYVEREPLTENFGPWAHLPGFPGTVNTDELLVVGVGFMVESLQQHFTEMVKHEAIKMLIPFPAPLSAVRRAWESVYNLESHRSDKKFSEYQVDALDISAAFDRIRSIVSDRTAPLAFAPFGPKPVSAAMCLYAMQSNSVVYYPQPKVYHPDYSRGVQVVEGKRAVYGHWIKHAGEFLYELDANSVALNTVELRQST